jgi:hypothetical protein
MRMKRAATITIVAGALSVASVTGIAVANSGTSSTGGSGSGPTGPSNLPDRVGVVDSSGKIAGFIDRAALERQPDFASYRDDPQAAADAWLRTPIPVTRTEDPNSGLVGYDFHNVGFVDLATYQSPSFDIDALLAQAQAKQNQDLQQFNAARGTTSK